MDKKRTAIFIEWSVMVRWSGGYTTGKYLSKECQVNHVYCVPGLPPKYLHEEGEASFG